MPDNTTSRPGHFCWFENGTTDVAAAKEFYSALFGWSYDDRQMGPGGTYSMLLLNGKQVGGLYTMDAEMRAAGIPPHWLVYVATENADESVERIKKGGGAAMNGPFDVMDQGRMAVVRDPQGATFAVWQAKNHKGVETYGEPGAPCWAELATTDDEAARAFYPAVTGWKADHKSSGPMPYTEWIAPDGKVVGGMLRMTGDQWKGAPPHWMTYIAVNDVDASAAKTASNGGAVRVPPMDIPQVGRFSVVADPAGAVFSLFKPA
jgi:predicted enzyme related to lactoylglutathione lyase